MEPSEYIFRLGKIKSKFVSLEILYYAQPSYSKLVTFLYDLHRPSRASIPVYSLANSYCQPQYQQVKSRKIYVLLHNQDWWWEEGNLE